MIYTVRNIADFLDVDFGFVRRVLDGNELRPSRIFGNKNESLGYNFYQLFIIKSTLEQLAQKEIFFNFEKEEIYFQYETNFLN